MLPKLAKMLQIVVFFVVYVTFATCEMIIPTYCLLGGDYFFVFAMIANSIVFFHKGNILLFISNFILVYPCIRTLE